MPFEPEQEERKVAAYVGLPVGLTLARFDVPDTCPPPEWAGYFVVHWGVHVEWDGSPIEPPDWPFMTAQKVIGAEVVTAEDGTQTVHPTYEPQMHQLWLIQAYRPGYPLAAERRWHPDLDVRDAIVGLHEPHTREDVQEAHHGQQLIMGIQERERSRIVRPRWFELRQAAQATRELIRDQQTLPTFESIHEYIAKHYEPGLPIDTLRSRWRLRGRDEPPILMSEVLDEARR